MTPIAVIAFNRPGYLESVLDTLAAQRGVAIDRIALFQDGAVNPHSGRRYAQDAHIAASVAAFRARFPEGEVFAADHNLGPALNIDRAERWLFEELQAPAGIIFEDDMVLSPHYLRSIEALLDVALAEERIGYVTVAGRYRTPLAAQRAAPGALQGISHNWAFGLTQRQWRRNQPYVAAYLEIVGSRDYRQRDAARVHALYRSWGFGRPHSSQDLAKTAATAKTGAVKVSTLACLGRNIGARGLHTTEDWFHLAGIGQVAMYPDPVTTFEPFTDAVFDRAWQYQARGLMGE